MNNEILVLRGPDRVRKRPTVLFSDDGIIGTTNAVKTLLRIFVGQAAMGFCSKITFTECNDGFFALKSYDKGFALSEKIIEGKPMWYYDFCEFFVPGEEDKSNYKFAPLSSGKSLYGEGERLYEKIAGDPYFDITAFQYVTEAFYVESLRDGVLKKLSFKKGYPAGELEKNSAEGKSYTEIRFKLDTEVFKTSEILRDEIADFLNIAAVTIPGLICEYVLLDGEVRDFEYLSGTLDYLADCADYTNEVSGIFKNEISATGKDRYNKKEYSAKLKGQVALCKGWGFTLHIHNHERVDMPITEPEANLVKHFNWQFKGELGKELEGREVKQNFCLILVSECENKATAWETAKQQRVANRMITDMASDILNDDFCYWLKTNRDKILKIFGS